MSIILIYLSALSRCIVRVLNFSGSFRNETVKSTAALIDGSTLPAETVDEKGVAQYAQPCRSAQSVISGDERHIVRRRRNGKRREKQGADQSCVEKHQGKGQKLRHFGRENEVFHPLRNDLFKELVEKKVSDTPDEKKRAAADPGTAEAGNSGKHSADSG